MNKFDISSFCVVRRQMLSVPHYTLSFQDRLYLSDSAYAALGRPMYVKLYYDKTAHTLTVRKASLDEALLNREKRSAPYSVIGSVGSDHRIGGVLEFRRLIQQDMEIHEHFTVNGMQHEDCLIFDLQISMIYHDGSRVASGE